MTSRLHVVALGAFALLAGGCKLCCAPFDYCNPMFTGGCDDCRPTARVASVYSDESYAANISPFEKAEYEAQDEQPYSPADMDRDPEPAQESLELDAMPEEEPPQQVIPQVPDPDEPQGTRWKRSRQLR